MFLFMTKQWSFASKKFSTVRTCESVTILMHSPVTQQWLRVIGFSSQQQFTFPTSLGRLHINKLRYLTLPNNMRNSILSSTRAGNPNQKRINPPNFLTRISNPQFGLRMRMRVRLHLSGCPAILMCWLNARAVENPLSFRQNLFTIKTVADIDPKIVLYCFLFTEFFCW